MKVRWSGSEEFSAVYVVCFVVVLGLVMALAIGAVHDDPEE